VGLKCGHSLRPVLTGTTVLNVPIQIMELGIQKKAIGSHKLVRNVLTIERKEPVAKVSSYRRDETVGFHPHRCGYAKSATIVSTFSVQSSFCGRFLIPAPGPDRHSGNGGRTISSRQGAFEKTA
jgi:hypothetical protein